MRRSPHESSAAVCGALTFLALSRRQEPHRPGTCAVLFDADTIIEAMVVHRLRGLRARSWHLHASSVGSVGLCIGLWIRAKTVDQSERGNAERRALFVGLWAPTLWLIGDAVERREARL